LLKRKKKLPVKWKLRNLLHHQKKKNKKNMTLRKNLRKSLMKKPRSNLKRKKKRRLKEKLKKTSILTFKALGQLKRKMKQKN